MRGLSGKRIVVAGGATGIGAATAERLSAVGARVVVGDINLPRAEDTAARIAKAGGEATAVEFDLSDDASVERLFATAADELGGLDGLFNVGAQVQMANEEKDASVVELDLDFWRDTFEINTLGYVRTTKVAVPLLLRSGGGSIVNTSSAAALLGLPVRPAYSASKLALHALTRHVASRFGKEGVRCNGVMPGMVLGETQTRLGNTEVHRDSLERTRSPRLGAPADLAAAVAFLLSDDAEWINGQVWSIDGGMNLRD